jgi:hypothetical protein
MIPCTVALLPHPDTPCHAVAGIHVDVERTDSGALRLRYTLSGDLTALRIAPPGSGKRQDALWRHTCCEAFLLGADGRAYREFNFSPAGDWQAYDFHAYRAGGGLADVNRPIIVRTESPGQLQIDVELSAAAGMTGNRLGLSAVLETGAGHLSYWALRHAPGQPDFHHTDAFALELT